MIQCASMSGVGSVSFHVQFKADSLIARTLTQCDSMTRLASRKLIRVQAVNLIQIQFNNELQQMKVIRLRLKTK